MGAGVCVWVRHGWMGGMGGCAVTFIMDHRREEGRKEGGKKEGRKGEKGSKEGRAEGVSEKECAP